MIYYVEDDANIRDLTLYALEKAGLQARGFADAQAFFAACEAELPDCALLDIMLPGIDGLEILRRLRANKNTRNLPIMMLTAKGTELDKVVGLDAGADDYLPKPFGVMELVSRVNALLRRAGRGAEQLAGSPVIEFGIITVDTNKRTVLIDGKACALTMKEFDLLALLLSNKDRVLSRDQIMRDVWETDFLGTTRTVDVHVLSLRQKLEAIDSSVRKYIRTVRGIGYKATLDE